LEKRLEEPGFWDNPEVSQQVMKELKGLQDSVKEIEKLYTDYEDMLLLIDMSAGEDEEEETAEEVVPPAMSTPVTERLVEYFA